MILTTHGIESAMYLIEFTENTINTTVFGLSSGLQAIAAFDETLLDDFISKAPFSRTIINSTAETPNILEKVESEVTQVQVENVWRLIGNILQSEPSDEFTGVSAVSGYLTYVFVIIDDNMYWSWAYSHAFDNITRRVRREWEQKFAPFINRDVLLLAYELINLSPHSIYLEGGPISVINNMDISR